MGWWWLSVAWAGTRWLAGGTVVGVGPVDLVVDDTRIVAVGFDGRGGDALERVDLRGRCITPGIIDSHVHLALYPVAAELAADGVVAAVDLASPLAFLADLPDALQVMGAGPMITAVGGYPTRSWGRDGYGAEVSGVAQARAAVAAHAAAGARVVKLPFGSGPALTDDEVRAAVDEAHRRGLKVAAHALTDAAARRAGALGADVLAHTPTERLADATVALWGQRAVITTLAAFGGGPDAIDNLRRLHEAGAAVLYGTDLGNRRDPRYDPVEVALMRRAGLTEPEILAASTSVPAAFWGFDDLGAIAVGKSSRLRIAPCGQAP